MELAERAIKNTGDILTHAIEHSDAHKALLIFDTDSELSTVLSNAYKAQIPEEGWIDFNTSTAEDIIERVNALSPKDLVVLVQSTNFRLNEFRFRIELFKRELKTVEHSHLNRMSGAEIPRYIETLAYDPAYYRTRGRALKEKIDTCSRIIVECPGTKLVYDTPFEPTKLNIGDYREMQNVGGTYPIGEVFSEPKDLERVSGEVKLFAFAGNDHLLQEYEPFTATIENGILSAPDAPEAFKDILNMIEESSPVLVREFGLGLNPAIGRGRTISDVTAFERMLGMHMSLGVKHSIYKKPGLPRKTAGYHIDVFLDLERIKIDDEIIYENGDFTI